MAKVKTEFVAIVKLEQTVFKKWHCPNLLTFVNFLNKNYPGWRYFNVFDKGTAQQVGAFTKKELPKVKRLYD